MGHKRLAIEAGEDPINCDIDYMVDAIKTVYDTYADRGEIRRVNVNIAATTVENYRKLKEANIGTYILFQETYHKPTYEKMVNEFKRRGIPYITVINKIDLVSNEVTKKSKKKWNKAVLTSTRDSVTIFTLKEELIKKLVSDKEQTLKV